MTSYDNMLLWHERDISHSSAERIIMPDATTLLDYALTRYVKVLKDLVVHEDKMKENIHLNYQVIFSQRVLNALIEKGLSREEAYDLIQLLSFKAIQEKQAFQILLKQDKVIQKHLSNKEVDACFTLEYYLKEVNTIYQRLGLI
jgi:adenylosuccinate lyase